MKRGSALSRSMQVVVSRKIGTADGIAPMHQLRPYLFSGLVALCAVFAVVTGSDAVRVFHSYFRLLSSGIAADARVLQTYWVKSTHRWIYPIPYASYSFPTRQGTVQRGEGRVTRTQFEQLRPGSSMTVIFDPAYPAKQRAQPRRDAFKRSVEHGWVHCCRACRHRLCPRVAETTPGARYNQIVSLQTCDAALKHPLTSAQQIQEACQPGECSGRSWSEEPDCPHEALRQVVSRRHYSQARRSQSPGP